MIVKLIVSAMAYQSNDDRCQTMSVNALLGGLVLRCL